MDVPSEMERFKSSMTIARAANLIRNKHTCDMTERHVRALNRLVHNNKHGFLLREVSELCQLFTLYSEQLTVCPEYEQPLCRLVALCSCPFLKERASDETVFAPAVIEVLSLLGRLALGESHLLRSEVIRTVAAFYSERPDPAMLEGLQISDATFNTALVERSAVAKSLVEALLLSVDPTMQLSLLHTLQLLSTSTMNCNHMLEVGAAHLICQTLSLEDPEQRIRFVCVEILWNLLEHGSRIQIASQLSSLECISILKRTFAELLLHGSGLQSRQLRNDLLAICSLVAQLCPDAPFVESGFLRELCLFATYPEAPGSPRSISESLRNLKLSKAYEDFELKKSLMCLLTALSTDPTSTKVMSAHKVIRWLLSFVIQNDSVDTDWSPAQFEELQLLALSCLCTLGPLCVEDYMTCQGSTRILLLVEWCTKPENKFKGRGNSFHGVGGRGTSLAQLRHCLRLLLSMCACGDEQLLQDLHEQGAIPMLVELLKRFLNDTHGKRKSAPSSTPLTPSPPTPSHPTSSPVLVEVQANILLILSCLCETEMHRKELFGGYDGVQLLVEYLQGAGESASGQGHNRLLLAATDCAWCTVVGNPIVEDIFLENSGVFVLLDLLQVCPANMQNLVLGVLVDLCENPKAIPHVTSWRGREGRPTWSLLARLWREEERDMGVPRGERSTISGTQQPLVGAEQSASGVPPLPSRCPSAAVVDITENMRAKIYALCCKMGFHYTVDELSTEDNITMCIIESYLDFKTGEVWYEVAGELAQEGLRPVTPDQECLQDILHTCEEKAEETLKRQHELIDDQQVKDLEEEEHYYSKIKQCHQMEEKAAADFDSFMKRTSDHKALQQAKRAQLSSIDASRASGFAIGDRFHSLAQHDLNVTTFCGRRVTLETTPMKLLPTTESVSPRHIDTVQ